MCLVQTNDSLIGASVMDAREDDDQKLSAQLCTGSALEQSQAFGTIYDRYQVQLWHYVRKQLDYDEDDALEVAGDTWLVFWRERTKFTWRCDSRADNPLKSWLFSIARNRIKSRVRQNALVRENVAPISLDAVSDFIETKLAEGPSHKSRADVNQAANRRFNQLIKQLKPTEQQIVTLRYYRGLTYTEISQQLGKSSGAVRTAHTRLLNKLRADLANPPSQI